MDEVSKRKGYREFVTVVSDVEQGCLLEVIDSHKQQEIIATLKKQPFEVRAKVKEVSVDMWAGFPKIVEEVFPNAAVVIDRFHVMKLLLDRLNLHPSSSGGNGKTAQTIREHLSGRVQLFY